MNLFLFFLPFTLEVPAKHFIDLAVYESFIIIKALTVFWILKQVSVILLLPLASKGPLLNYSYPWFSPFPTSRAIFSAENGLFEAKFEEV